MQTMRIMDGMTAEADDQKKKVVLTSQEEGPEVSISVRNLVEFILRYGDIDNRSHGGPDNAFQEGNRIHRMIQKKMGAGYQAEVTLKVFYPREAYTLTVEGRADGIFELDDMVTIDEIKGTFSNPARLREPMPLHLAQAKCYAYMYAIREDLEVVRVRMTYCHIPTERLTYFFREYSIEELEEWFVDLLEQYSKWADYSIQWNQVRTDSIRGLPFPFPYREGLKELAVNVYRTIYHRRKLFLEAPTGVGKTISTIYPAVQAMGQNMAEKIFYLTAKTITRTVADETFSLLRQRGLHLKSVILTAKEKICFLETCDCNPEACPYARGHFDRINDCVYDLLTTGENFNRETIETYARKHRVCPFEMCLDVSLFADAVICDYNYLFDPHVYLKRFFQEGVQGEYIFLIDEAHNLLERGREMYSAVIWKEQFMEMRRDLKLLYAEEVGASLKKGQVEGQIGLELSGDTFGSEGDAFDSEIPENEASFDDDQMSQHPDRHRKKLGTSILVREGYAEKLIQQLSRCNREMLKLKRACEGCRVEEDLEDVVQAMLRLSGTLDDYLEEQEHVALPIRDELLDLYFDISHFLKIYELVDEHYVNYSAMSEDGEFMLKLFCVDPSANLEHCMDRGRSSILFSATFLPIQYYKKLLGGTPEDYEVYARTVFQPEKRALFIAEDVTSKYSRRSEEEFEKIADYIEAVVENRHGNYMVFCPSYAFLRTVYQRYLDKYGCEDRICLLQMESMNETDREEFLALFRSEDSLTAAGACDKVLIGFCVLGGIFGEGIDLKKDSLIGAIIVGTGLPQVCFERELIKDYFDQTGENGFDYAYKFPGMNKVLQAAGRVIRTVEDVGLVALLDERFLQFSYRRLFPEGWESFQQVKLSTISKRVEKFWNEWL